MLTDEEKVGKECEAEEKDFLEKIEDEITYIAAIEYPPLKEDIEEARRLYGTPYEYKVLEDIETDDIPKNIAAEKCLCWKLHSIYSTTKDYHDEPHYGLIFERRPLFNKIDSNLT